MPRAAASTSGGAAMKHRALLLALATLPLSSACSSIIEGTSQTITLNTNPPGADCALHREGLVIGRINPTPGSVVVQKTKHDILITCAKPGYQEATYHNNSGVAGATFGNIILGGGIGWAIDSAAGADNKYESPVNLTLSPNLAESTATMPQDLAPLQPVSATVIGPASPALANAPGTIAAPSAAPGACTWNPQRYRYEC
jgi:hypothetical protein